MAVIRLKRRASAGAAGAPPSLATTEPAFNEADDTLYLGKGDNGSGTATSVVPIAGRGAFVDLATAQTVPGLKTFSVSPKASVAASATDDLTRKGEMDTALAGKAAASHTHAIGDLPVAASGVSNATQLVRADDSRLSNARAPTAHTHLIADLPVAASGVSDTTKVVRSDDSRLSDARTPSAHVHATSEVTGLDAALTAKAPLASPALTGTPTAPTPTAGDNTTKIATTAFVAAAVDAARQGLSVKDGVRVATTANITLSGTQTIDGVAVVAGDRVLVKNQTTASANGIYIVAAGAWTRSTDFDVNADVANGAHVFVEEGSTQSDSAWVLTNDGAITIGTTALAFAQFSGAGQIVAGNGLSKSGNTLAVGGTAGRISVGATTVDIDAAYVGQTSITTLGTVTTGVWDGGTF